MKKWLIVLVLVMLSSSLLFSSGGQEESKEGATPGDMDFQGITLRVAGVRMPPYQNWIPVAEEIAAEMGMKIETVYLTADDVTSKILLDAKAGMKTWDLFYVNELQLPSLVKAGALSPIADFVNNADIVSPDLDLDDFIYLESAISDGTWGPDGTLWGFPWLYGIPGLEYRKDLYTNADEKKAFKNKFGYELRVPETYTELRDVAEFFTRKKGELLAGKVLNEDFYGISHSGKPTFFLWHDFVNYFQAFGGRLYDPITMLPEWNSSTNKKIVEYFKSLIPYMPPNWSAIGSGESTSYFVDGKVATIIEYEDRVFNMATGEDSKIKGLWDYTLLPSVEGVDRPHAAIANLNMMGIYGHSENKLAAYKLLERLSMPDIQKKLVIDVYAPPTRKSIMQDQAVRSAVPDWFHKAAQFGDEGVYLFSFERLPEFSQVVDIVATSLHEALTGQKNVDEALAVGQEQLVALFKEIGYIK